MLCLYLIGAEVTNGILSFITWAIILLNNCMYGFVQLLPQCTQALCMHMYVFFSGAGFQSTLYGQSCKNRATVNPDFWAFMKRPKEGKHASAVSLSHARSVSAML